MIVAVAGTCSALLLFCAELYAFMSLQLRKGNLLVYCGTLLDLFHTKYAVHGCCTKMRDNDLTRLYRTNNYVA